MVSKDIIIDSGRDEISIALLEDKTLVELNKEKKNLQFTVGDIYLGKYEFPDKVPVGSTFPIVAYMY